MKLTKQEKDIINRLAENGSNRPDCLYKYAKEYISPEKKVAVEITTNEWKLIRSGIEELIHAKFSERTYEVNLLEDQFHEYIELWRKLLAENLISESVLEIDEAKISNLLLFYDTEKKLRNQLFTEYGYYYNKRMVIQPKLKDFIKHGYKTENEMAIRKAREANIIALIATFIAVISMITSVLMTMYDDTNVQILREVKEIHQLLIK